MDQSGTEPCSIIGDSSLGKDRINEENYMKQSTVVHWKKVLPQKFWVVPIVGVGPRLDL